MNELAVIPTQGNFIEPAMPRHRGRDTSKATIAGRKGDDFTFKPRHSAFYLSMPVRLASYPIQIAFNRTFERCQLALFETEMIAPLIARNDDAVLEVNKALDTKLKAFEVYMDGELSRANKILSDNSKKLDAGDYTDPIEVVVRIFTPRSRVYVQMLQLADDVISAFGRLFLEGFMDEVMFKRSVFAVRVRTINLARDVWDMHTRSYKSLMKARQNADAERQRAKDANDRARLDAKIEKADAIIGAVDSRGGMEASAPDFGATDLAADSPTLMAEADKKTRAKKTKGTTPDAEATDSSAEIAAA